MELLIILLNITKCHSYVTCFRGAMVLTYYNITLWFGDSHYMSLFLLQSPDLNPPGYFLWGAAKQTVYQNRPRTIEQLQR